MATTGRRTAIVAGACGLAVAAGAVVLQKDDLQEQFYVWRLSSARDEVPRGAIEALAMLGCGPVPRLLREVRRTMPCDGPPPQEAELPCPEPVCGFGVKPGANLCESVSMVLKRIGEPAIPLLISRLDDENWRFRRFVLGMIVRQYLEVPSTPLSTASAVRSTAYRWFRGKAAIRSSTEFLEILRGDDTVPADIGAAAAEMLAKLNAKQATAKAE